ncbi:MAG: hypothetical protein SF066_01130 [Thermoanaerobaculia bacterium]|nr:hypothetical protein [Thermoanaerobaculia bacterium]
MNFRTKDLMINVIPEVAINPDIVRHTLCHWLVSAPYCWRKCSVYVSEIPRACRLGITLDLGPVDCTGTPACAGSMTPWLEGPTVEGINVLRDQLKARIAELDDIQASFQDGPANLAEAETLEAHLKDALTQVQAKKAELRGAKK